MLTSTVITAGSHHVFYEYQFNDTGSVDNVPFALSELGDMVFLTAADAASNLTRVVDIAEFEASDNGVSFGRYPNGTGPLVAMAGLTLGTSVTATNPPRVPSESGAAVYSNTPAWPSSA